MRLRVHLAILAATVLSWPSPVTAQIAPGVRWVHPDHAFFQQSGVTDVNGDGTDDVIALAGDRNAAYVSCVPCHPGSDIHQRFDAQVSPARKILALDGVDGTVLWERHFSTEGSIPAADRTRYDLLEDSAMGDLDGDGQDDLLVAHGIYPAGHQGPMLTPEADDGIATLTMFDPSDGSVVWERTEDVPDGSIYFRSIEPASIGGRPAVVVSTSKITYPSYTFTSTVEFLILNPGLGPTVAATLETEDGVTRYPFAVTNGDRTMLAVVSVRVGGSGPALRVHAYEIYRDEQADLQIDPTWTADGFGGIPMATFPAVILNGPEPVIVLPMGQDTKALSMLDGSLRWTSALVPQQPSGTFQVADVNGDATDDVIGNFYRGALYPTLLFALDGATGSQLWSIEDQLGTNGVHAWDIADVDGDGTAEVVTTQTARDPFVVAGNSQDEAGYVGVYDGATGAARCRFHMQRQAWTVRTANVDGQPGEEILVPTLGGTVYAFGDGEPGCGALRTA